MIGVLLIQLLSFSLHAEEKLIINKSHSTINFFVTYLKFAKITGNFQNYKGSLKFDKNNSPTELKLVIEAQSINTNNKMRDSHLKRKDFFFTSTYPQITYYSQNIKEIQKDTYKSFGTLNIKGIKKEVVLDFSLVGPIQDTWQKNSWFANVKANVNRNDFGLSWNKTLEGGDILVNDKVEIGASIQLQKINEKTSNSHHQTPDSGYLRQREKYNRGETPKIKNVKFKASIESTEKGITITKIASESTPKQETTLDIYFWMSYLTLCFFGLIGSLGLGIKLKHHFASNKVDESHPKSIISDLPAIILLFLFTFSSIYLLRLN